MKPAWSVVIFTTLAGAGQGLFLALFGADVAGAAGREILVTGSALVALLLGAGLVSSFFHLGHPERAWRTATMWRTSWLSREVIALPLFMALVAGYGLFHYRSSPDATLWLGLLGVAACLALFYCTAMIYACLPFLQEWRTPFTPVNFLLLGCASGLTLACGLAAALDEFGLAPTYALCALAVGLLAYVSRILSLRRNARLRPKSTLQSAIGVSNPRITQIAQGAMGGSFNTREFFHGRPREVVRAARWAFFVLGFPLPALLIVFSGGAPGVLAAAFLVQYAGLLAERWYFFAEAKHPQNLYYQAIS